ncbi:MAG: hypothetical protein OXFUSZZB_000473 [Candidatus Fervidibacter sp.]|jgi:prepilin-type N-terminal cleavage/methylation domain-containing protein
MMLPRRWRSAFTLIELLVVITIIAIMAAILFPVFAQAREKARQAQCNSNIRNIALATAQYSQDHDERFPFWRTPCWGGGPGGTDPWYGGPLIGPPVPVSLDPYVKNRETYKCPSTGRNWSWPLAASDRLDEATARGWWACRGGYGIHPSLPFRRLDWIFFTSYGYNEFVQNNAEEYTRLAKIQRPAEFVLWGDSEQAFFTPWGWMQEWGVFPTGVIRKLAFPEIWPADPNWVNIPYGDEVAGRHLKGILMSYADGHAKWSQWRQVRMARPITPLGQPFNGPLRTQICDEVPDTRCSQTWFWW